MVTQHSNRDVMTVPGEEDREEGDSTLNALVALVDEEETMTREVSSQTEPKCIRPRCGKGNKKKRKKKKKPWQGEAKG